MVVTESIDFIALVAKVSGFWTQEENGKKGNDQENLEDVESPSPAQVVDERPRNQSGSTSASL